MSLGVNNQTIIQNYPKPQTNTTFKANPVVPTNTLERTPTTDTLVKPTQNKTKKILLTLGGIVLAGVGIFAGIKVGKAHQQKKAIQEIEKKFVDLQNDMPKVQKTFKEVFLREDLTEKEALEMLNRYKEIEKIGITSNKEKYIEAVFKEAKRNFGFNNKPIELIIKSPEDNTLAGACDSLNRNIWIRPTRKNSSILKTIHHEFRHAKQHELAYNFDPSIANYNFMSLLKKEKPKELDRFIDSLIDKHIIEKIEINEEVIKHFSKEYETLVVRNFGSFTSTNVPDSQKELAKKLAKSYNELNADEYHKYGEYYRTRFFEQDARFAEESIAKLFGLMAK